MKESFLPDYAGMDVWESYSKDLLRDYRQSIEEGLDVERYKSLFEAVAQMPDDENKDRIADVIFDIVCNAPTVEGYPYEEPSDLEGIKRVRRPVELPKLELTREDLFDKVYGAWMGRVCGCMLGKTLEGIRTYELIPFLKESGNYPMHRYVLSTDATDEVCGRYGYGFAIVPYVDKCGRMPADDDTNYTVLAQELINSRGRDFTPNDVANIWVAKQSMGVYCTAERTAFKNFVLGYRPPVSAKYKNVYRELIGAQIRGDYFGYINPGDTETAADMAFRDASISHIKNGIYGEMYIAAMIAAAAVTDDLETIVRAGLGEIPQKSRLAETVREIIDDAKAGLTMEQLREKIYSRYDENDGHDWTHTISNAAIVTAALLTGEGDYGRSICAAVQSGFDTDCNGATVGSILGMRNGIDGIGKEWTDPINDTLDTAIFGVGTVSVSERARMTLDHIKA